MTPGIADKPAAMKLIAKIQLFFESRELGLITTKRAPIEATHTSPR